MWLGVLSIKFEYYSKRSSLMVYWAKQIIMLWVLNFMKAVAHISIYSPGCSLRQILKMKLPTLTLLRNQCMLNRLTIWAMRVSWVSKDWPSSCAKQNSYEKQEVLLRKNTLLRQVKSCINNDLNPAKVSAIDPTKDTKTMKEIPRNHGHNILRLFKVWQNYCTKNEVFH